MARRCGERSVVVALKCRERRVVARKCAERRVVALKCGERSARSRYIVGTEGTAVYTLQQKISKIGFKLV